MHAVVADCSLRGVRTGRARRRVAPHRRRSGAHCARARVLMPTLEPRASGQRCLSSRARARRRRRRDGARGGRSCLLPRRSGGHGFGSAADRRHVAGDRRQGRRVNGADMLTQKLLAHLPLLAPRQTATVYIIGLGSGVTLAAALRHPIDRVDVSEISPEVIAASAYSPKRIATRCTILAHAADRGRWPIAPAAVGRTLRRHRLRALQPVDGRRLDALHARVLPRRSRTSRAGRHPLPVGAHLQHQRGRSAIDCCDVPLRVSGRQRMARRRIGPASDWTDRAPAPVRCRHRRAMEPARCCGGSRGRGKLPTRSAC